MGLGVMEEIFRATFVVLEGWVKMKKWPDRPLRVAQRTDKRLKATFKKLSTKLILWYNLQKAAIPLV